MNISRITKFIIFLFILIILDQVSGFILRRLYFNQKAGPKYDLNYFFTECKDSIIILGNSRAHHSYDTRIISDSLHMSCYNAGMDGSGGILFPYAQTEVLLNRFSPKIIIIEIDSNGMEYNVLDYDELSILLPYYRDYPELRQLLLLRNPFEQIKLLSSVYPFNSDIMNLVQYNIKTQPSHLKNINGYAPIADKTLNQSMLKGVKGTLNYQTPLDTNKIAALRNIIKLCRDKNVRVVFINSPNFHLLNEKPIEQSYSVLQFLKILRSEEVDFIDLSNEPIFRGHMELFSDIRHLNERGASVFSRLVAGYIKQELSIIPK